MKSSIVLLSILLNSLLPSYSTTPPALRHNLAAVHKKTVQIQIYIETSDDDLRGGSWANLYINNTKIENFTNKQNLPNNSSNTWTVDCPNFDPANINSVRLEHVSHEDFPQTADNWNINLVKVAFLNERNRWEEFAKHGPHRFDGSNRTIMLDLE